MGGQRCNARSERTTSKDTNCRIDQYEASVSIARVTHYLVAARSRVPASIKTSHPCVAAGCKGGDMINHLCERASSVVLEYTIRTVDHRFVEQFPRAR